MIKLRFYNEKDLFNICYQTGWEQVVYIDGTIQQPDVKHIDIVETRDGIEIPKSQITQELYKLRFLAPEFIWRALKNIHQHSFVEITMANGEIVEPDNVRLEKPAWVEGGIYAVCELEFVIETVIRRNTVKNLA